MSAAERLRALDRYASPSPWHESGQDAESKYADEHLIITLRNTLPALIEAIKQAETIAAYTDCHAWARDDETSAFPELETALVALDAALGEP